mmetsp:Transcript_22877/g.73217  ORF Transcript_22877/g.73217 Transcript_22877/m.73217 type:complete len:282 (+) Transcript_22877:821-1666(+)
MGAAWAGERRRRERVPTRRERRQRVEQVHERRARRQLAQQLQQRGPLPHQARVRRARSSRVAARGLRGGAPHEREPRGVRVGRLAVLEQQPQQRRRGPRRGRTDVDALEQRGARSELAAQVHRRVETAGKLQRRVRLLGAHAQLRQQLLDVGGGAKDRRPRLAHGEEEPVGLVEAAGVQMQVELGPLTDKEVGDKGGGRVVRAVHKGVAGRHRGVPLSEEGEARGVERADRLGEVAVDGRVGQVEGLGGVVLQNPRHHRELREVGARAAGRIVEVAEVLVV